MCNPRKVTLTFPSFAYVCQAQQAWRINKHIFFVNLFCTSYLYLELVLLQDHQKQITCTAKATPFCRTEIRQHHVTTHRPSSHEAMRAQARALLRTNPVVYPSGNPQFPNILHLTFGCREKYLFLGRPASSSVFAL